MRRERIRAFSEYWKIAAWPLLALNPLILTGSFRRLLASVLVLGLTFPAGAAPSDSRPWGFADPAFQHITPEQGLPNGAVTSLAQDAQGFLWIGSLDGLARWDGYRLKVFRQGSAKPSAPASNAFLALHTDRHGQLWAGAMNGGLLKYDASKDRLVPWQALGPNGLSGNTVHQLIDDGAEGLWIATNGGLDRLEHASGRVSHPSAAGQWAEAAGSHINAMLVDREGRFWLGTSRGLFLRAAPTSALVPVPLGERAGFVPGVIVQDAAGRVWVGSKSQGAYVLTGEQDRIAASRLTTPTLPEGPAALDGTGITGLAEARPGEMWLATLIHGIVAVNLDVGWSRRIRHVPDNAASLLHNSARLLLRDRAGLMWVGTSLGVSRHDPQRDAVLQRFGSGPDQVRLNAPRSSTEVSWIQPMPDGGYWLGTHRAGIERLDANGRHLGALLLDAQRPAESQDMVLGMACVADGSVYVATDRGLFHASRDGQRVERVRIDGRDLNAHTWAVLADGEELWIGGRSDGLWRLDLKTGRGSAVRLLAPGLSDPQVTLLAGSRRDGIWVGSRNGLNRVNVGSGGVTQSLAITGGALSGAFISTMITDARGRRWVGSYGGGIDILPRDGSHEAPIHLGLEQGLPAATVNALLQDASGDVWVSMDGSLARIDPERLTVQALGRSDGVLLPTYWTGAAARGGQGELLFGGAGGVTVVNPARFKRSAYVPQVLISDLRVGEQGVPLGLASSELQIAADHNSMAIELASSAFAVPERNRFAYKLEGLDPDWRETDASRRTITYSNLPPGEYTLRLRASNGDGLWSDAERAMRLHVQPAWHQTWWFRAVVGLTMVAAFVGAVALRTRILVNRQRMLEARVRARTAELEAAHRALEEKSRQLELSSLTDPLTGLHNRRYVAEHIERDLAAGRRRAKDARASGAEPMDAVTAFLLVDLDRFKQVNDRHGHAAGDAVLVELGLRLRTILRESDYLVRWGGEEFLAIARDTDGLHIEELAERMRNVVARTPFALPDGRQLAVTCSIGFACMALAEEQVDPAHWPQIVDRADKGLYAAKRAGRDAWVGVYSKLVSGEVSTVQSGDGHWLSSNKPLNSVAVAYSGAPEDMHLDRAC